ncbi:MAG: AAA family ATPase [Smithella sp.]|jgi:type II secretory pathway predicted ATPase ExeA
MYTEYWNLTKPPFDNVPDSSMYVDCHESMENVISETIFAIKEGNECFAVIFGDVGLGKTLSLRVIIDSLEPEKYKVALITNPALSFIQLLREIIGQITGKQCEEKKKVDLLEIFNRLLFETNDQGQKIVIVIDESNVLTSANLDDLRLLTNMQDDEHNLFTLILAGQIELAEKLEHPKMANLFQRIGTYGHIEKLPSEEALKTYVETRLKFAGSQRKIFTDDAIPVIWEFSEYGTPRLINKICKLCLKAGETNEFQMISGEVVSQIADRFRKISKPTLPKSKIHSRPEIEPPEEKISETDTELPKKKFGTSVPRKAVPKVEIPPIDIPSQREARPVQPRMTVPEQPPATPIPPQMEEARPVQPRVVVPEQPPATPILPQMEEVRPVQPRVAVPEQPSATPIPPQMEEAVHVETKAVPLTKPVVNYVPIPGVPLAKPSATNIPPRREAARPVEAKQKETEEQPAQVEKEVYEEVLIGQQKVELAIPANVIKQAQLASSESKNKLAGYWSAQIIKENPHIMRSSLSDPVAIWFEVKNVILKKFNST